MPADMLTDDYARAGGLRDDQRPSAAAAAAAAARMQGTELCVRLGLLDEDGDERGGGGDGHSCVVIGSSASRQVDCRTTAPGSGVDVPLTLPPLPF